VPPAAAGSVDAMKVTITGAAGRIGGVLVEGLLAAGHDVRGIDLVGADAAWADRLVVADLATDDDAVAAVVAGADAVVHLAAIASETDLATALGTHVVLTHRVLEACRAHGVGRIVYASSNHAVGFTPRAALATADTRARPDTFYGLGKVAGEGLCSLYHDRHRIEVACLRIGSFRDRPTTRRHLSTWLSHGDAVRLVDACLRVRPLGYAVVYGISANTRAWWDLAPGRAIGYEPVDDAERWAAEVEAVGPTDDDVLDARYLGGDFTRPS
jgi:uronate dehydrogenase